MLIISNAADIRVDRHQRGSHIDQDARASVTLSPRMKAAVSALSSDPDLVRLFKSIGKHGQAEVAQALREFDNDPEMTPVVDNIGQNGLQGLREANPSLKKKIRDRFAFMQDLLAPSPRMNAAVRALTSDPDLAKLYPDLAKLLKGIGRPGQAEVAQVLRELDNDPEMAPFIESIAQNGLQALHEAEPSLQKKILNFFSNDGVAPLHP
jgi:hypothetical protein